MNLNEKSIVKLISDRNEQGMILLLQTYGALIRYVAEPFSGAQENVEDCL